METYTPEQREYIEQRKEDLRQERLIMCTRSPGGEACFLDCDRLEECFAEQYDLQQSEQSPASGTGISQDTPHIKTYSVFDQISRSKEKKHDQGIPSRAEKPSIGGPFAGPDERLTC